MHNRRFIFEPQQPLLVMQLQTRQLILPLPIRLNNHLGEPIQRRLTSHRRNPLLQFILLDSLEGDHAVVAVLQ